MVLLEFHYWTDVVMWGVISILILSIIILVLAIKTYNRSGNSDDDPTGEIKQQIFDKLNKAIKDIESTV